MYTCVHTCVYIHLFVKTSVYKAVILRYLCVFTSLISYYARTNVLEDFCSKFSTSVMEQILLGQLNY